MLKGGGDAASAARAVIQTGDYDFGWNIAIEPEIAASLEATTPRACSWSAPDIRIERININFSDPRAEVDGQRSEMNTPHPILSDLAVRQAMNLGHRPPADRRLVLLRWRRGTAGREHPLRDSGHGIAEQ